MKTLQAYKESLCLEKHKKTYREFYLLAGFPQIIQLNDEAAELYAQSAKAEAWDEGKKALHKQIADNDYNLDFSNKIPNPYL